MPDASQISSYARLLRLTPVYEPEVAPQSPAGGANQELTTTRRFRWPPGIFSFVALVVLPTCLATAYFTLLAADRYQSEARFVLRMPGKTLSLVAPADMMQNLGVTRSNDDGYIVQAFLESRDAMEWLRTQAMLEEAYAKPRWDFFWRFPNPFMPSTREGLYRQYERMVAANFDSATGVNSLKVQAFTPADAKRLAGTLLDAAEALVNRLNERARHDAVAFAETEAEKMRQRTLAAQGALTAFRERERLVDPTHATLAVLETIAKLSQEAAQVSVQLSELAKSSPSGPQLPPLRSKRAALEEQISLQRQRLAGDAQSIAPRIAEYERLMLEREFAEKALIAAMTSVEVARLEAMRQRIYLERVAAPGEPDYPAFPWRFAWCLAILAGGCLAWRIWRIVAEDSLQHTEL